MKLYLPSRNTLPVSCSLANLNGVSVRRPSRNLGVVAQRSRCFGVLLWLLGEMERMSPQPRRQCRSERFLVFPTCFTPQKQIWGIMIKTNTEVWISPGLAKLFLPPHIDRSWLGSGPGSRCPTGCMCCWVYETDRLSQTYIHIHRQHLTLSIGAMENIDGRKRISV